MKGFRSYLPSEVARLKLGEKRASSSGLATPYDMLFRRIEELRDVLWGSRNLSGRAVQRGELTTTKS